MTFVWLGASLRLETKTAHIPLTLAAAVSYSLHLVTNMAQHGSQFYTYTCPMTGSGLHACSSFLQHSHWRRNSTEADLVKGAEAGRKQSQVNVGWMGLGCIHSQQHGNLRQHQQRLQHSPSAFSGQCGPAICRHALMTRCCSQHIDPAVCRITPPSLGHRPLAR